MPDAIEQQLTDRLRALGDTVPNAIDPPAELEVMVERRRRRHHNRVRTISLGLAAALVLSIATVAVIARSPHKQTVDVSTSDHVSHVGRLKDNVVLLDARGRYVVALDANGHQVDTLVVTASGSNVVNAQVTSDHETLWYLARDNASLNCGRVVRADIGSGDSTVIAHASQFTLDAGGMLASATPCGARVHATAPKLPSGVRAPSGWKVEQVVTSLPGVYVLAVPPHQPRALYRVEGARLVHVRTFDFGALTPVLARG